jgi:hypothetical protein
MYLKIDFMMKRSCFVTNQTFCYILERVFITICYRSNNVANITFNSIFVTNITMLQIKQYVTNQTIDHPGVPTPPRQTETPPRQTEFIPDPTEATDFKTSDPTEANGI